MRISLILYGHLGTYQGREMFDNWRKLMRDLPCDIHDWENKRVGERCLFIQESQQNKNKMVAAKALGLFRIRRAAAGLFERLV